MQIRNSDLASSISLSTRVAVALYIYVYRNIFNVLNLCVINHFEFLYFSIFDVLTPNPRNKLNVHRINQCTHLCINR